MADTIKQVIEHLKWDSVSFHNGSWEYAEMSPQQKALAEIKRIVTEAKPNTNDFKANPDYSDMLNRYNSAHNDGYNMAVEIYHTNLMKALGE